MVAMPAGAVRAVLFDMDGTLVDSRAAVERAWTTWAIEFGADPAMALAHAHGGSADDVIRRLIPSLSASEVVRGSRRQLELQYDDLKDVKPTRGAIQAIAAVQERRMPWAVVTNADARLAAARLGAAGIDPPLVVTIEDVAAGKPHPAGYRMAATRLGVPPANCLAVEDSVAGIEAGVAAGMQMAVLGKLDGGTRLEDLGQLVSLLGEP